MLLLVSIGNISWWMVLLSMLVPSVLAWFLGKQSSKDTLKTKNNKIKQLQQELKKCYQEKQIISTKLVKPEVRFSDPQAFVAPGRSSSKPRPSNSSSKFSKVKDDLEIIEGIGPKMKEILNENGISTWRELSLKSYAELKRILRKYGDTYRIIDPKEWPLQARLADHSRWTELIDLQTNSKSGNKSVSKATKILKKLGYL